MTTLTFKELEFKEIDDKVRVFFLGNYYFDIKKQDLGKIGKIKKNSIEFKGSEKKFNFLINQGFANLKNKLNDKKTIYLHKNLNIPLIGLNYIGLVDRNTNLIEVKPNNGCNFNCVYCSIDSGLSSKRQVEFIVEKDFLIQELKKLIKIKQCDQIEIYINPHGEPLLYKPLVDLIKDMSKIKEIKTIGMSTNGLLLTKSKVDELIKAGLSKFNISLNSIDEKTAKRLAGLNYNNKKILEICKYISKKAKLFIAPVLVPGFNDNEIPKIIEFSKKLDAKTCIQNFLNYRFGRNPIKAMKFDDFFKKMRILEKQHNVKLIVCADDFSVKNTKKLKKPFKKGDIITAEILFKGCLKHEKVGFSGDRLVSILNCEKTGKIRLKIVKSKHNLYVGIVV